MSNPKLPTHDDRQAIEQMNLGRPVADEAGNKSRVASLLHNASQFMAGMYTGIGCSGTPKPFESYLGSEAGEDGRMSNCQKDAVGKKSKLSERNP